MYSVQTQEPTTSNSLNHSNVYTNEWSNGLFDCCTDCQTCVAVLLCTSCYNMYLHHKADES